MPAGFSQAWSRIWTQYYHEQIQLVVSMGLELGASELQVQHPNHWVMLLPSVVQTALYLT